MLETNTSRKDILPADKTFGPIFFNVIEGNKTKGTICGGPNGFWHLQWKVKDHFLGPMGWFKTHKFLKKTLFFQWKKELSILADQFSYYRVLQALTNNL